MPNAEGSIPKSDLRIDRALRDFVRRLDEASSYDEIAKALSHLGSHFQMPNVHVTKRHTGEASANKTYLFAPTAMQRAANALMKPPLAGVFAKTLGPITLGDAVQTLGRDWNRPRELAGFEAVAANIQLPASRLQIVYFGKHGVATGLSKSLLFIGAHLAADRRAAASGRPEGGRTLSDREQQALEHAKGGLTDAKIGKALGISTRTVRFHLANAMRKSGVGTRAQLITKSSQKR